MTDEITYILLNLSFNLTTFIARTTYNWFDYWVLGPAPFDTRNGQYYSPRRQKWCCFSQYTCVNFNLLVQTTDPFWLTFRQINYLQDSSSSVTEECGSYGGPRVLTFEKGLLAGNLLPATWKLYKLLFRIVSVDAQGKIILSRADNPTSYERYEESNQHVTFFQDIVFEITGITSDGDLKVKRRDVVDLFNKSRLNYHYSPTFREVLFGFEPSKYQNFLQRRTILTITLRHGFSVMRLPNYNYGLYLQQPMMVARYYVGDFSNLDIYFNPLTDRSFNNNEYESTSYFSQYL
jgi:hypothetical protein